MNRWLKAVGVHLDAQPKTGRDPVLPILCPYRPVGGRSAYEKV